MGIRRRPPRRGPCSPVATAAQSRASLGLQSAPTAAAWSSSGHRLRASSPSPGALRVPTPVLQSRRARGGKQRGTCGPLLRHIHQPDDGLAESDGRDSCDRTQPDDPSPLLPWRREHACVPANRISIHPQYWRLKRLGIVTGNVTGGATVSPTEAPRDSTTVSGADASDQWAWVELNYRPHAYQACALTT
jgi:hypothetical protein